MRSILLTTTLLVLSTLCTAEEQVLYVQSARAKLMAEPSFGAAVVSELDRGTAVNLILSQKRWLKVQAGKQSGWVSSFLLSNHPPMKKVTVLGGEEQQDIEENARRRASAVTTAGAARGLSADDRKRADMHEKADFYALEQVEEYKVDPAEVSAFAKEGHLK